MKNIIWRQAIPTGIADALVWVWFLQTAYLSRLTDQLPIMKDLAAQLPYLSVVICLVLSAALMAIRWNAIPTW